MLPVVCGPDLAPIRIGEVLRRNRAAPGQREKSDVALLEQGAGTSLAALESDPKVAGQRQLDVTPLGSGNSLVVALAGVLPPDMAAAVFHHRLAVHDRLDFAGSAADGPQQNVLGLVIVRCSAVGPRAVGLVVPRPDQQTVADDDPTGGCAPACFQDHRARQVANVGWHRHVDGRNPERTGSSTQDAAEDARRIEPRNAHPLHGAVRRDQCQYFAVTDEPVLTDRSRPEVGDRAAELMAPRLRFVRHRLSIPCRGRARKRLNG